MSELFVANQSSAFNRARLQQFDSAFSAPRLAQHTLASELARIVQYCYRTAAEHRCSSGVQEQLEYSLCAYEDRYDPKTAALIEKGRDVYIGLTSLKCRAMQGWLQDILVNNEDKPWVLTPSPQPQLPERVESVVVSMLERELGAGQVTFGQIQEMMPRIRSIANAHAVRIAEQAVKGLSQRINGIMIEGGWREVFEQLIVDVSVFPAAIVRGPVVQLRDRMRWIGDRIEPVREPQLVLERVSPFDFFPSPDSTNPQDGGFVVERAQLSREKFMAASNTPGFIEEAVRRVVAKNPNGTAWWNFEAANDEAAKRNALSYENGLCAGTYKTLCFFGKVQRRSLIEYGIEGGDPQDVVEAEVWVCDGEVIRAEINPRPLNMRPFHVAKFQPVPGAFWGRSLPWVVKDPQRVANAAVRALVGNMGLSSGPIVEMDHTRLEGEEDPQNVFPWRVYFSKPGLVPGSSAPAIRFHTVNSEASTLQGIVDRYTSIMDEISGIPPFAVGSPQTGGAGRTLGGLSMLLGNAARGIKRVITSMDKGVFETLVTSLYHLEMLYGQDGTIKVDAQVQARGSSGLLARQLNQNRAVELLGILAPFVGVVDESDGSSLIPVRGLKRVMQDIVKSMGYSDGDVLPDPNRPERLAILGNLSNPAGLQQEPTAAPPGTPPPLLDGRSQAAIDSASNAGL